MFSWISKQIASNAASNAINKVERRISGKRIVMAGIGFTLFISNEDMDDIIRMEWNQKFCPCDPYYYNILFLLS